eukprot:TRINITY_DN9842_c0_g2_i2.p2 TRINITY_DN9842_c0_g2~~TRINITY_DN9842_c0_g2_i2.p2  ORF type:complete len:182 (-),score=2.96 TRINITY_DN9842_c0_g2_i2:123-668(-)
MLKVLVSYCNQLTNPGTYGISFTQQSFCIGFLLILINAVCQSWYGQQRRQTVFGAFQLCQQFPARLSVQNISKLGHRSYKKQISGQKEKRLSGSIGLRSAHKRLFEDMTEKGLLAKGQQVDWTVAVDPSIKGGVVYHVGDLLVDCSVKSLEDEFFQSLAVAGFEKVAVKQKLLSSSLLRPP